jgi:tetratricopeptide (TPR) repeat protein
MQIHETPPGRWNLFASVLQEILAARGLGLGHLDDRANIHREKVRRLQLSLKVPRSFPVLNIDEMERVITTFRLNREEKIRLRAAILATSIEETLMERINPDDALKAAEQILDIIEQALQEHAHDLVGIGAVKGGNTLMSEESEIDRKLGNALTAIDHATIALHLSRNADSQVERVECAQQARVSFTAALAELDRAAPALKGSDAWLVWHNEAQNGLAAALSHLASLGV